MNITIIATSNPLIHQYVSLGYGHGEPMFPLDINGKPVSNPVSWSIQFYWDDGGRTEKPCRDLYDACRRLHIYPTRIMDASTRELVNRFRDGHIG